MSEHEHRKCGICGHDVKWVRCHPFGWHPVEYHDCKPVPRVKLEQAERERDEARALLEHARKIITDAHPAGGGNLYAYFVVKAIDSLLAEQPEPARKGEG